MSKEQFDGESLVGSSFGKWKVIKHLGMKPTSTYIDTRLSHNKPIIMKQRFYLCKCECGVEKEITMGNLKSGKSKACPECKVYTEYKPGTIKISKLPLYKLYQGMLQRCYNKNLSEYQYYGGRGINVCARWLGKSGLINFTSDMGERPSPGYSLDRIDVNGNYEPANCRWADILTQANNKTDTLPTPIQYIIDSTGVGRDVLSKIANTNKFPKLREHVGFIVMKGRARRYLKPTIIPILKDYKSMKNIALKTFLRKYYDANSCNTGVNNG